MDAGEVLYNLGLAPDALPDGTRIALLSGDDSPDPVAVAPKGGT